MLYELFLLTASHIIIFFFPDFETKSIYFLFFSNNWERFVPHSNVHWLYYLADKIVYRMTYPAQSGRQDRDTVRQFRQFMSGMIGYSSSSEMVVDSLFLNTWKRKLFKWLLNYIGIGN